MQEYRSEIYMNQMKDYRRLIETVIAQLSERFNIEKMRARRTWRVGLRFMRKILAHTMGMLTNKNLGRDPLKFEALVG